MRDVLKVGWDVILRLILKKPWLGWLLSCHQPKDFDIPGNQAAENRANLSAKLWVVRSSNLHLRREPNFQ